MSDKKEHNQSRGGLKQAGPQGTQVFSRKQLGEMLEHAEQTADPGQGAMLIVESEAERRQFPLKAGRVTIGRSRVCDLYIEEPSMSSEHARMVHAEGAWRIINLLSTNGVFVNGEKVFSHELRDGDEIRLGRARLLFRNSSEKPREKRTSATGSFGAVAAVILSATAVIALITWLLLR